jgi:hypothetical protein
LLRVPHSESTKSTPESRTDLVCVDLQGNVLAHTTAVLPGRCDSPPHSAAPEPKLEPQSRDFSAKIDVSVMRCADVCQHSSVTKQDHEQVQLVCFNLTVREFPYRIP